MQTRHQTQVAKTEDDIQVDSQSMTVIEDEVMHETATTITTTSTDLIMKDEHMEVEEAAVASVPERRVTPVETRGRLSEPKRSTKPLKPLPRISSIDVPLVRSLTLDVFHTVILDMPFSNLIRLQLDFGNRFRIANASQMPHKALALICRNTRLQELKVNCAWRLLKDLDSSTFQFLCSSRLRSLNLEDLEYSRLDKIQAILAHCPDTLQELRLLFLEYEDLGFEDDDNPLRLNARAAAVPRILPNLRVLTLDIPTMVEPLEIAVCDLIQSCPRLQEINLLNLSSLSNILTSLTRNTPPVNTVSFYRSRCISGADMLHFLARCSQLRSLELADVAVRLESVVPTLVNRFGTTLQELILYERHVPPNGLEFITTILAHCSCLKKLSVDSLQSSIVGIALQDLLAIEWASTSLENLSIPIKEPFDQIEQGFLLQEWRQHQYMYLQPDEYDPEGIIARSRVLIDLLLRLYRRLQAQSRLKSLKLAWHRMWYSIPLEFAEVFGDWELAETNLQWMKLFLFPLDTANKNARSAANHRKKAEEDRALTEKLSACNISVVAHVDVEPPWMDYRDENDYEVDYDPFCFLEDQEHLTYKSRGERTRSTQRK
ncbi:MAG: hypothetical protein J3R72DRAFT_521352 [Linnemannia gamsii]|nr:MAG: hypothetical protein J3R72DRAFT_521352 [Linnemannia gamsii]